MAGRSMLQTAAMALFGLSLFLFLSLSFSSSVPSTSNDKSLIKSVSKFSKSSHRDENSPILNSTLGFQKVFAVNLPSRSDKRDALALAAAFTNFSITFVPAISGEDVPDKALPSKIDRTKPGHLKEAEIGSWRAHMNVIREVVEKGYETALIMEDDMDWDIRLKEQLLRFAKGSKYVLDNDGTTTPYGDNWDVLWVGNCVEELPENYEEYQNMDHNDPFWKAMTRKFEILNDETMPPPNQTRGVGTMNLEPGTRVVHRSGAPICSFAYAVSQRGARKIMWDMSIDQLAGSFDNALAEFCRWGSYSDKLDAVCVSSSPGLFFHHRPKGSMIKDSDIQVPNDDGSPTERKVGYTENIVNSVVLNLGRLVKGEPPENQFKDGTLLYKVES